MKRWLKRAAFSLLLLVLVAALAVWVYSRRSLPRLDGRITLAEIKAGITIERDAEGIPTIKASSREDALFGLGYVHAQDRLWQLEVHKRIGAGRLSEVFGAASLPNDKFLRALGVRRAAAAQLDQLSAESRAALTAYAAGINAFVQSEMSARPPEFMLLGVQPEPWTPEDSLAWATMMAWDLGANWTGELLRMRLALKLPVDRIQQMLPPYEGDKPLATADYAALFRELKVDGSLGRQALLAAPPSGVEGLGSNNWAVSGERSATGKPLLANDPHLRLQAPALWYLARLEAPGMRVAGATIPGMPMVVLGQNEHLAWGFTNTAADVQDLYLERIDPADPTRYQTPTGWAAFETVPETIHVKNGDDVHLLARRTRHGPVISDAGGVTEGLTGPRNAPAYVLAMRWTALDTDSGTLDAALGFHTARGVDEVIALASKNLAPMQNIVVADVAGRIGSISAGRVPVRKPENDLKGLVPAPGWDARYDWAGVLEPTWTPREIDPSRGWVATANQRIHAPDYPHFITSEWTPAYRQKRIEQLLAAKPKLGLDDFRAMQADTVSLATQRLLPYLRNARSPHALAGKAHAALSNFNGDMKAEDSAPLIFWAWARQLTVGILRDEAGGDLFDAQLATRNFREAIEGILERDDVWWCNDKATPANESCGDQIDAAFTRALIELQAKHGSDVAAWKWGRAHVARSEHRPFTRVAMLSKWFTPRVSVGGDTFTIDATRVSMKPDQTTGELYLSEHGPSLRALYDIATPGNSRAIQSTGQSGNVFSPLYRGFSERWGAVADVPLWGAPARHVLRLVPGESLSRP